MNKLLYMITLLIFIILIAYLFQLASIPIYISGLTFCYFILTVILSLMYKPARKLFNGTCDIIVPAYNEGKHAYDTVQSILDSNFYNFNVIVIDDGSNDDTPIWISKINDKRVKKIYLKNNQGKKHALYAGIKQSSADVIVTIDSDTTVNKNTIKNLLRPFNNIEIGAVSGNIRVKNISDGIISQMMDIIFMFCFVFLRSAQSTSGNVLCTSGALSAYRRSALLPIIDEWLEQKFCGEYTTIGEDRALTTLLLKNNWKVVYQSIATGYTKISNNYLTLSKMLLRWLRGDIRENIFMFNYIFNNLSFKNTRSWFLLIHYIAILIGVILPVLLLPMSIIYLMINSTNIFLILAYTILISFIWSSVPAILYAKNESISKSVYAFLYGIFSLFCLSWIPIYALLTVTNNKWLTRI